MLEHWPWILLGIAIGWALLCVGIVVLSVLQWWRNPSCYQSTSAPKNANVAPKNVGPLREEKGRLLYGEVTGKESSQ
jgi:hypothetical protein